MCILVNSCMLCFFIFDNITKTYLYNFDPFQPHFYIVKLGFTGVYVIFLISAQKHRMWYSLEPPRHLVDITKTCLFKYTENSITEKWKFLDKNFRYFSYFCSKHRGGSNEYPQSVFLSRNKENNVYSCKPHFYYMRVGFKGVKII